MMIAVEECREEDENSHSSVAHIPQHLFCWLFFVF